jgi:hypothetical protein
MPQVDIDIQRQGKGGYTVLSSSQRMSLDAIHYVITTSGKRAMGKQPQKEQSQLTLMFFQGILASEYRAMVGGLQPTPEEISQAIESMLRCYLAGTLGTLDDVPSRFCTFFL